LAAGDIACKTLTFNMKYMTLRTALLLAFSATLSACAQLEPSDTSSSRDAQLVRSLVQANLAEIEAGRLAVSRAQSRAVRGYAQRMIDEHTQLQAEASELKSAKGVPLPTRPDESQQAALKKLAATSGAAFDLAYIEQMLKDHADTLQLLERTAARATDPALRAHAELAKRLTANHLTPAKTLMR
jgi:putative membrane protein